MAPVGRRGDEETVIAAGGGGVGKPARAWKIPSRSKMLKAAGAASSSSMSQGAP
jgi:hypothetical protein